MSDDKKLVKNHFKDYQKYINKFKDPINKTKTKDKATKPPKGVSEEVDVFLVTIMIQTKHSDDLEHDMGSLIASIEGQCLHTEKAPFMLGTFCGFGLRLIVSPEKLGAFFVDFGDYIDLSPELAVKEMNVEIGQAQRIQIQDI